MDLEIEEIIQYKILDFIFDKKEKALEYQKDLKAREDFVKNHNISIKSLKEWSVKFYIDDFLILWVSEEDFSTYYLFKSNNNGFYKLESLMTSWDRYNLYFGKTKGQTYKELNSKFKEMLIKKCDLLKLYKKIGEIENARI